MNRLFLLADLLIKKGIRFTVVLEVAGLSLPFVITYIMPLAVMVAGIMSYGKLSCDNELTAIKSSGVSLLRLLLPCLFASLLLSFFMVGFNGFLLPESEHKLKNLLLDLARKKPAVKIREGVFMDEFGEWTIYVGSLEGRSGKISDVLIFKRGGRTPLFITSPTGRIVSSPDGNYLSFHLFSGEIHELEEDRYRRLQFSEHIINIPVEDELVRRRREYRSLSEMSFAHLLSVLNRIDKEKGAMHRRIRRLRSEERLRPDAKIRIEEEKTHLRFKMKEGERYAGEFHKRVSLAFSCISFFLFGSFLGIVAKKGSLGFAFLATLIFFAVYYILLIAGEHCVKEGNLPALLGMWLPNIVLVPIILEFAFRALFDKSLASSLRRIGIRGKDAPNRVAGKR